MHKPDTAQTAQIEPKDFSGLQAELFLAPGARVMLRQNLWTEAGLANGSMGTVVDIVYKPGATVGADLPIAAMVSHRRPLVLRGQLPRPKSH